MTGRVPTVLAAAGVVVLALLTAAIVIVIRAYPNLIDLPEPCRDSVLAPYEPTWSADGSRVVFEGATDAGNDLYVVDADGGKPSRMSHTSHEDGSPAWSPEGDRLAVLSEFPGELYVVTAAGSRRLTATRGAEQEPTWSPDGRTIAFAAERPAGYDVFVINPSSRRLVQMTRARGHDDAPRWSPDGRRLLFVSERKERPGIYVIDVAQRREQFVAHVPTEAVEVHSAAWAPDGRSIVFNRRGSIYVVSLASRHERRVADDATGPDWSPDGQWIAYMPRSEGGVAVVRPSGDERRTMADDKPVYDLKWSPDSRALLVTSAGGCPPIIGVVDIESGDFRLLAGLDQE